MNKRYLCGKIYELLFFRGIGGRVLPGFGAYDFFGSANLPDFSTIFPIFSRLPRGIFKIALLWKVAWYLLLFFTTAYATAKNWSNSWLRISIATIWQLCFCWCRQQPKGSTLGYYRVGRSFRLLWRPIRLTRNCTRNRCESDPRQHRVTSNQRRESFSTSK